MTETDSAQALFFDCVAVYEFACECQTIIGRLPGLHRREAVRRLSRLAQRVPDASTALGRALVHYVASDLVLRVRPIVPGWRAEWETMLAFRVDAHAPTAAVIRRTLTHVAIGIAHASPRQHGAASEATHAHRKVEAALDLVWQRCSDSRFRLSAAASLVHLSPSHLDRLLTRHTGFSFVHHLRTARLQAAQNVLRSTLLTIKEVAGQVGYNSVTHLDRDFRKYVGCTPSEWRDAERPARGSSPRTQEMSRERRK